MFLPNEASTLTPTMVPSLPQSTLAISTSTIHTAPETTSHTDDSISSSTTFENSHIANSVFASTAPTPPSSDCNVSVVVAALVRMSNIQLASGCMDEALAILDVASSMLNVPSDDASWSAAVRQYDANRSDMQGSSKGIALEDPLTKIDPPDLYQEDECDVGPRMMRTPAHLDCGNGDMQQQRQQMEIAVVFNKALVHHLHHNNALAKQHYEIVLLAVRQILNSSSTPSYIHLEVAMKAHNNLGVLSYAEYCTTNSCSSYHSTPTTQQNDTIATTSFTAATHFAKHLANFSPDNYRLDYATTLSNWCRVHWMLGGDRVVGDTLYQALTRVLSLRAASLEWDHPDVAAARYNVAVADYGRHDTESALTHLRQYLRAAGATKASTATGTASSSETRPSTLDTIPARIVLLLIQNEDKEDATSQDLVRGLRTLQDMRQDYGPDGLETASVLNYVGTLLFHQLDYEHSLSFFREELRLEDANEAQPQPISDNSPSPMTGVVGESTSVSVTCNNIGRILQELGRFQEAIAYYRRALEVEYGDVSALSPDGHASSNKSSTPTSPKPWAKADLLAASKCQTSSANLYSTVWYNLGIIYDKLGSYDEAINGFEMSVALRKVLLGSNHPDIACLLYNIGVLQMEQQRLTDASTSLREALRIRRVVAAGPLNDRHVVKTLEKLASLHKAEGNIAGALEANREVLTIQKISAEYTDVERMKEMGISLRAVAELHHAEGDIDAAVHMAMDSVNKLRIADGYSVHQVTNNTVIDNEPSLVVERISCAEQLVSSLLLLGSLYHEICEPLQAEEILRDAAALVRNTFVSSNSCLVVTTPSSLRALREVTVMLSHSQCAPQA